MTNIYKASSICMRIENISHSYNFQARFVTITKNLLNFDLNIKTDYIDFEYGKRP